MAKKKEKKKNKDSKSKEIADEDQWWYKFTKEACVGKPVHKKYKGVQLYGVMTIEETKKCIAMREERDLKNAVYDICLNVMPLSDAAV